MRKVLCILALASLIFCLTGCFDEKPDFTRTIFIEAPYPGVAEPIKATVNPNRTISIIFAHASKYGDGMWDYDNASGDVLKINFNIRYSESIPLNGYIVFYENQRQATITVPGFPLQVMGKWYQ